MKDWMLNEYRDIYMNANGDKGSIEMVKKGLKKSTKRTLKEFVFDKIQGHLPITAAWNNLFNTSSERRVIVRRENGPVNYVPSTVNKQTDDENGHFTIAGSILNSVSFNMRR